jgi:hypothetical protein
MYSPRYDKAAEYRRQAREARTLASQISINDARSQLLETATHLEALAEEEERKTRKGASIGGPGAPEPTS